MPLGQLIQQNQHCDGQQQRQAAPEPHRIARQQGQARAFKVMPGGVAQVVHKFRERFLALCGLRMQGLAQHRIDPRWQLAAQVAQ